MSTKTKSTEEVVVNANNEIPATTTKRKRKTAAEKTKEAMAVNETSEQKEEIQNEVQTTENEPKETTPKISKFEKVTTEFCAQNKIDEVQLYKYLLKKSVGKKTNLNSLAEGLMNDSFFNKEKMLAEILG